MPEIFGTDCYSPQQIAQRVEEVGVIKSRLPLLSMVALGVLAGGFIGLGAMFASVVLSDSALGFAAGRVLAGLVFSLGLILVIVAGAELFTGNNLLIMGFVAGQIPLGRLIRNLAVVYFANLIGAVGLAALVAGTGIGQMGNSCIGRFAVAIATAKVSLPFTDALLRGILCNLLVCLAVWLAMAGRSVADKVLAIVFPISAFVAAGFEHSVANMYIIPLGIFWKNRFPVGDTAALNWIGFLQNLIPVTAGNLIGGAGMVGLVYYVIYCRHAATNPAAR